MKLTLVQQPELALDFSGFFARLKSGMTSQDVMMLPVHQGNRTSNAEAWLTCVGDFNDSLELGGPLERCHGIGHQWSGGDLVIDGNCGHYAGTEMSGGRIFIRGDCGSDCGAGMKGGQLLVHGNAGDRLGGPRYGAMTGMQGGEIFVKGRTGRQTGQFMRRGLIAASGTMGAMAGHGAIAGTIATAKGFGHSAGFELKRATLISMNPGGHHASAHEPLAHPADAAVSWAYAGLVSSSYFTLLFRRLNLLSRQLDSQPAQEWFSSNNKPQVFDRYLGDQLSIGRGEWLIARQN